MSIPASDEPIAAAEFATCAVIGAGTMGTGIGYVLAAAGARVLLVEPSAEQVERSRTTIAARVAKLQRAQSVRAPAEGPHAVVAFSDLIGYRSDVDELPSGLDLIVESVPEHVELKRQVLRAAERRRPRLLGTNTSAIAIAELADGLQRPGRLVGLHFFNPVWSTALLEVIRPAAAGTGSKEHVDAARRLAALLGKEAIVVADRPGFATSRLGVLLGLEAMRMLEDGVAGVEDLDRAMELGYGHPMGPLRLSDLIGLDVRLDIARNLQRHYGDRFAPPQILIDKVARGELGRKSGQGFHPWS